MIGKLKGTVEDIADGEVILDVNGVGYVLHCSSRTLADLPPSGEPATLYVETVVREDMIRLYGFATRADKEWFLLLQNVQGVGAKVALGIQATLSPADIAAAVAVEDKATIARAPGVGPRLAQRIASELKGKIPEHLSNVTGPAMAPLAVSPAMAGAVSALTNLGYQKAQAMAAVSQAIAEGGAEMEERVLIRLSLRALARAA